MGYTVRFENEGYVLFGRNIGQGMTKIEEEAFIFPTIDKAKAAGKVWTDQTRCGKIRIFETESDMDHGDTSTRLVWAADFHRKHPTASQARIQQELKNKFGMGIRTQSMDSIFKGDGVPTPKKECVTPRGQYSKNIPAKAQTIVVEPKKESTLEQYIRLGVKKVTLPDGTVLEF